MSQVSKCTAVRTFGTDGTLLLNQFSFLQERPLQQFNTQKTPCLPSAGNGDLVGVFQIVSTLILLQERCHGFLGQRMQGILMFSFGQNILTGFLALFFTTFGMLTRAFIETIDEVSGSCVEALSATGASYLQCVFQAIIPSSLPGIVSWVLYMIETNIRSSTLIGMLTATGIGYLFDMYYKSIQFPSAGLIVLFMVIMVIIIETISNKIRKVIL